MNNQALKLLLRLFRNRDSLTPFEMSALTEYARNSNSQEVDYFALLVDRFYDADNRITK